MFGDASFAGNLHLQCFFLQIKFELTGSNLDKKDLFSESDPYFTISRMNPDGSDTLVYRSEWISNNASPEWAPVEITSGKLCNGDWNRNLRIEVYDHDTGAEDDYIGAFSTNLEEVICARFRPTPNRECKST